MANNTANGLVEQILPYERDVFLVLNHAHNLFGDSFMWIYSDKYTWLPLAIVALGVFVYKVNWRQALLFLLCFVLMATLCDQLSSGLIKPFFERFRPSHHPNFREWVLIINNYRGGRFGFISSHAANGFGIATFIALVFRNWNLTIAVFLWAVVSSYSRIYLGVHFISDILGGILLGILVGFLIYKLFQYSRQRILKQSNEEQVRPAYSQTRAIILTSMIYISFGFIILFSTLNCLMGLRLFF